MEKLFDGEFRLMEILWREAPIRSAQLVKLCTQELEWNKSTTYTVLRRLCAKGAAQNQESVITPLLTRQQVIRAEGDALVEKSGGIGLFFNAFLSGRSLTDQEIDQLQALIDQSRKGE